MDSKETFKAVEANGTTEVEKGSVSSENSASFVQRWAQKIAFERGGIQRVTDQERQHHTTKWWNACTFW